MENRYKKYQNEYIYSRRLSSDGVFTRPKFNWSNYGNNYQSQLAAGAATVEAAPATVMEPSLPVFDMDLPGEFIRAKRRSVFRLRRKFWQNWAVRGMASVLAVCMVTGGWLAGQAYYNLNKTFNSNGITVVSLQKEVDPNRLNGEGDGRVNILLLGNGGPTHKAPDLTDTIMVASIDPVNHKVALVSVPRDLWVEVPGHGHMKINAAYSTAKYDYLGQMDFSNANDKAVKAGFTAVDQAVEEVLGIKIHYNMLVNFTGFKKAVNTLGGIKVEVPQILYDPSLAWENNWSSVIAEKGKQKMDGHQALLYARSRKTSSDFDRSERQRAVLMALKEKAVSLGTLSNPLKISALLANFGDNVKTDLSIKNAARVYELTKDIDSDSIKSLGLGYENELVETGRVGNQSVVLPTAGLGNYDAIQKFIRQNLPDGFIVKENAKIQVMEATLADDQAKRVAAELKTYGYNVVSTTDYPGGFLSNTQVIDVSNGQAPYTKNYLEQRFNVLARNNGSLLLPESVQTEAYDFIIVVGSNEANSR